MKRTYMNSINISYHKITYLKTHADELCLSTCALQFPCPFWLSGSSSEAVDSVDLWLKSDCATHTAAISSFRNPRRVRSSTCKWHWGVRPSVSFSEHLTSGICFNVVIHTLSTCLDYPQFYVHKCIYTIISCILHILCPSALGATHAWVVLMGVRHRCSGFPSATG